MSPLVGPPVGSSGSGEAPIGSDWKDPGVFQVLQVRIKLGSNLSAFDPNFDAKFGILVCINNDLFMFRVLGIRTVTKTIVSRQTGPLGRQRKTIEKILILLLRRSPGIGRNHLLTE